MPKLVELAHPAAATKLVELAHPAAATKLVELAHPAAANSTSPIPKAVDLSVEGLAAILTERIRRGMYRPGCHVAPERVLAAEFGVSRRYVRLAYNRLVRDGLIERNHHQRPFVPLKPGQSDVPSIGGAFGTSGNRHVQVASSVKTIAAVLPFHPVRPGGLAIVAGIHRVLADCDSHYRVRLYDTYDVKREEVLLKETKALAAVAGQPNVEGLIYWCYNDDDLIAGFMRECPHINTIFIDRRPSFGNLDFVGIDDIESSRAAVESLFDLGHVRIAHVMDPGKYSTIIERSAGYREAHIARGVPVDTDLVVGLDWSADRIETSLDHLFSLDRPPTAVFASNDFIAYEFIAAAESRGIGVPRDLSVVGHGNIDQFTPRQFLSTVEQPFELIGHNAARLLLQRLQAPPQFESSSRHIILQAPLILRKSCGPPASVSARRPLGVMS